jgi:hypothetical protein
MADQTVKLLFEAEDKASAAIKDVNTAIDGTKTSSENAHTSLANFGKLILGIGTAIVGAKLVKGAVQFGKEIAQSAAEDEAAWAKMAQAVENTGASYDDAGEKISDYVNRQMLNTAFSEDQQLEAIQKLTEMTGDYGEALDLTSIAMDMSAATGQDLASAAQLVGRVAAGDTTLLKRYGIIVEEGATATEALATVSAKYAGQAQLMGDTALGSSAKLTNAWGEVKDALGTALSPAIGDIQTKLAEFLINNLPAIEAFATKIGEFLTPAFDTLSRIASGAMDVITRLMSGESFSSIWEGTGPMLDEMGNFVEGKTGLKETFAGIGQNIADFLISGITGIVDKIPGALDNMATKFAEWAEGDGKLQAEQVGKDIAGFVVDSIKSLFSNDTTSTEVGSATEGMMVSAVSKINTSGTGLLASAVSGVISGTFDSVFGDGAFSESMSTKLTDALTWWYQHMNIFTVAQEIIAKLKASWELGITSFKEILSGGELLPGGTEAIGGGIKDWWGGLFGGNKATGFSGIVSKPTLMMVGEGGTERVSVRPTGGQPSGGGNSIVFNIYTNSAQAAGDAVMQRLRARGLA